ncbi:MAG: xylulokinase [Acidimicrobiia bacterium]
MSSQLIVGFDVGTTSLKGVAFDADSGQAITEIAVPYETWSPRPGWTEQRPHDWLSAISDAWPALMGQDSRRASAIGIVSQVNTHVFVDDRLRPLIPAIVWNDLRSAKKAAELDARLTAEDRLQLFSGSFTIDASYAPSRWAWLQSTDAGTAERVRWILSPKDYCIAELTGAVSSDAISSIGLVDSAGAYIQGLDSVAGDFLAHLPILRQFDEVAGVTNGRWGLPTGIPVAVGTMDAWGNVYGSGVTRAGQGMEVSGTSEIVGIMTDVPGNASGVISFPPVRGRYLHAGPTQAGGRALSWVAESFSMSIRDALEAAASADISQRLVFLPHLQGERAPVWNPSARGVWLGLTTKTGPREMIRAVLEGVAFSARWIRETCEEAAGIRPRALRISGGGSKSTLWNEIKASAHGVSMEVLRCSASGCLGAALMGGVASGLNKDIEDWAHRIAAIENVVEPEIEEVERLQELYSIYRDTYDGMHSVFERISRDGS